MIEIQYSTRLGNKLFQYALGRILSTKYELFLPASPISGFPATYQDCNGRKILEPTYTLKGQKLDIPCISNLASSYRLILNGNFQQAEYYLPWFNEIRSEWLAPLVPQGFLGADPESLVIHLRRTDYLWQGWGLPFSTYKTVIEAHGADRIVIVTDDANDPFIRRFRRYKPIIRSTNAFSDFLYLRSAANIMLSPSTFSWWAAFLSDASRIYYPVPKTGIWSPNHEECVNLEIPCDNRYITVFAEEPLELNAIERLYFERLFWRLKLSNLGVKGYVQSFGDSLLKRLAVYTDSNRS